ncbi:hypothetical protein SAMN04488498_110184 [Mesorhizobium albiziae]|uniref:Tyr recombinase domain-containing protein n=1 Tax=Neomesorhizobium albiziae TaxID=335020 RepID=A0A1I4BIY0_9HYPH|nr:integrase [Mesorhizobium albiziae]GLS29917.1 hypothetical protein GCM10007937_16250 [Mesorhizobium albiziae]SFK68812.1 hypothetical protein SAMN04488498_110184 [Mesorhizobium albiziae]
MEEIKAPGLKWIKRAKGATPFWVAGEADVKAGYHPKTVNLAHLADAPEILKAQCDALQAEMLLWRAGHRRDPLAFDGTVRAVLSIYQTHPDSPYHVLKPGSLRPYNHYLGAIEGHIGKRRLSEISGLDIKKWHRVWSNEGEHLAAAAMARAVLEAALSFGKIARLEGCAALLDIVRETRRKLPNPRARTQSMTADQVVAAREAAHAAGRPSRALAYAFVFETALRLWDVIGQWHPIDAPGISDVIDPARRQKWFGLQWDNIGDDMVVRYTPSKTADRTGASIIYPLSKAPMVLEELRRWPIEARRGPVIVSEECGRPYINRSFGKMWKADAKAAGIPGDVWARDLRASAVTEGRAAGAARDDARQVAGHSNVRTTAIYDRAGIEAAERFADARIRGRKQSGNDGGNGR